MNTTLLDEQARQVLRLNDIGSWTQPAEGLYPHQWLWDSCFIAIGLAHLDVHRAQTEIRSLLKGQWQNGMVPHILFSKAEGYHAGPWLWQSAVNQNCPPNIQTSGITQPPLLAEAVVRIGRKMNESERKLWYEEIFPALAAYHEWLYRERDPKRTGMITIVHPWETGLDNTPPWMEQLKQYTDTLPWHLLDEIGLTSFIEQFRKDTSVVAPQERISTKDLSAVYIMVRQLHHNKYDSASILKNEKVLLVDLAFNCILMRANTLLKQIADEINQPLPSLVQSAILRQSEILESFWDEETKQYYSLDYHSGLPIKVESVAGLLPIYACHLANVRLKHLLASMREPNLYKTPYMLPTTPQHSSYFNPHRYWQGPVWVNMNWLIIDGLIRNNRPRISSALRKSTLEMVSKNGMNEYFSPLDGSPAGISNFSWTAALTLDLLRN